VDDGSISSPHGLNGANVRTDSEQMITNSEMKKEREREKKMMKEKEGKR
jgi:hypothetical protein